MQRNNFFISLFIIHCALCIGCNRPHKATFTDSPTAGEINIVCDESYQPLITVETDTFMGIYKNAKVRVTYLPEGEAFKQLVNNDSVRLIVSARELSKSEKEYFDSRKIIPRATKIAVDAIALIINKQNPDSLFKFEQLKNIFSGEIATWKIFNPKSKQDSITIVFDKSGSANAHYLQNKFLSSEKIPSNWFAVNSNSAVVDYVNANKNAIGVVSVNWISDKDDPAVNSFLDKIIVAEISPPDTSKDSENYFKPYQAYIYLKQYPLIRDVFIVSREGRAGLGTGFASFVAGDQGQRLVRLMGMLPASMPVRLVQVN